MPVPFIELEDGDSPSFMTSFSVRHLAWWIGIGGHFTTDKHGHSEFVERHRLFYVEDDKTAHAIVDAYNRAMGFVEVKR